MLTKVFLVGRRLAACVLLPSSGKLVSDLHQKGQHTGSLGWETDGVCGCLRRLCRALGGTGCSVTMICLISNPASHPAVATCSIV